MGVSAVIVGLKRKKEEDVRSTGTSIFYTRKVGIHQSVSSKCPPFSSLERGVDERCMHSFQLDDH
jgi:hypothetical protein